MPQPRWLACAAILTASVALAAPVPKPLVGPPDPKVEKVRSVLHDYAASVRKPAGKRTEIIRPLLEMGENVFPIFEKILKDPDSESYIVRATFEVLISMNKEDRRRFADLTVERLADPSWAIRWKAVVFLRFIGSDRDTGPVIALLSDPETGVCWRAAETLAEIGGPRDIVAMDAWLNATAAARKKDDFWWHVKKQRDHLEERLRMAENLKNLKN